jgi:hypothetical protein
MTTRGDIFPSKYLRSADLQGKPVVCQIDRALVETLKSAKGEDQTKVVLYFVGKKKSLPLNMTNFDSVADIAGDTVEAWRGHRIEIFPTTTSMSGRIVDCIRVRPPTHELPIKPAPRAKPAPAAETPPVEADMNDSIPW